MRALERSRQVCQIRSSLIAAIVWTEDRQVDANPSTDFSLAAKI